MDEFEWLPTECAHERYPMQLISGPLYRGDDEIAQVPTGKIINNGWGEVGSRRLVGPPQKPVPDRLELAWFSFTEDCFHAGTVPLPVDELTELFATGFREPITDIGVTWSKIIVGMGLGGWTSVWLAGSGLVREVVRVQVPQAELDWSLVLDNPDIERSKYIKDKLRNRLTKPALEAHNQHGPPVSSWPRLSQRFRWRLLVEGIQVPLYAYLRGFNGERSFFDFGKRAVQEQAIAPKHLQVTWLTRSNSRQLTEVWLDEQEVYAGLDRVCAADPTSNELPLATLRLELASRGRVTITLERDTIRVPLTRAKVEWSSV